MIIKKYDFDSNNLIAKIGFLLGSDEWQTEHNQALRRQKGKVFYLLIDEDALISMCSVYRNQILDCHTLKPYRNKGYILKLLKYVLKDNSNKQLHSGTANECMEKVFISLGMKYKLNRGKYRYYYTNGGNYYEKI